MSRGIAPAGTKCLASIYFKQELRRTPESIKNRSCLWSDDSKCSKSQEYRYLAGYWKLIDPALCRRLKLAAKTKKAEE